MARSRSAARTSSGSNSSSDISSARDRRRVRFTSAPLGRALRGRTAKVHQRCSQTHKLAMAVLRAAERFGRCTHLLGTAFALTIAFYLSGTRDAAAAARRRWLLRP